MELKKQAIQMAIDEVMNPQWAATQQIMAVHQLQIENRQPAIARVHEYEEGDAWSIYFRLADEPYYLTIPVGLVDGEMRLNFCDVVPDLNVYFLAYGTQLTPDAITNEIGLSPTRTVHMDDVPPKLRRNPWTYQHKWRYEPQQGVPAPLDEKLKRLLDDLRPVQDRIAGLEGRAETVITIGYYGYCGSMGGMYLDREMLALLASLRCTLDLDLYASGLKSPD